MSNNKATMTPGQLHLVGVGPGDPELMTIKAVRVLQQSPVWAVPTAAKEKKSCALDIAKAQVSPNGREVLQLLFPMKRVYLNEETDVQLLNAWTKAAKEVFARIDQGLDVAFPTLGDPGLYSTAFYLLAVMQEMRPGLKAAIVPGITAMSACSAGQNSPLALGNDVLAVVPAACEDERLRHILTELDAVVLMKVHRRFDALLALLDELGLTDKAVLIERAGLPDERIYSNIREAKGLKLHYFSTMLIRKKVVQVQP